MGRGDWGKAAAVGLGLLLLMSCRQEKPKADSCLSNVDSNALPQALERCNRVVAAHPKDAKPLNDRFILYTLLQNKTAACKDIRKAATLISQKGELYDDIEVRLDSCGTP